MRPQPDQRSPRAERTRTALIAAGRRLFCDRAVDAVTIDDIVQAAEVGKGSFYNHFADREALVRAISAEIRAGVERAVERANVGVDDPARRLARACCTYMRFALDDRERAGAMVRVHSGLTSLDAPLNRGLVDDISAGLAAGRFRVATLDVGVLYVMGVTQMALARIVHEPSAAAAVSLAQQMCAMILSGLRVPDAEADLIAAQASDEIVRPRAFPMPEGAIRVHALLLGERLSRSALDADGAVTTAPLSFKVGDQGLVVLFRYGAAVLFGLDDAAEAEALKAIAARMSGPVEAQEDETAQIVVRPGEEEQVTPSGAIQLRAATPDHLLIVADALAKSVALARDERQVAAVFDAIEPFAVGLSAKGRSPGGRSAILRMIGRALLVQHRVSGRVAVREKPDILWDRPDLGRLYGRLEDEYELIERAETLDRKLAFISTAASALIELKDADRSLRLEIVIILLILAEVALAFIQLFGYWR